MSTAWEVLTKQLADLERRTAAVERGSPGAAAAPARADSVAVTSPEIQRLERELEATKRQVALTVNTKPGELREVVDTDRTGRKISRFYGDNEACWGPFKQPLRACTGINTK